MCEGSGVSAELDAKAIPRIDGIDRYIEQGCLPGGTERNFRACEAAITEVTAAERAILCDPQTSGGLLIAVAPDATDRVQGLLEASGLPARAIGSLVPTHSGGGIHIGVKR